MKSELKKLFVYLNTDILNAMKILNKAREKKCLIVVDKNHKLLGTLTDGDLRRGILKGKNINSSIKSLYKKRPFFLTKGKFKFNDVKNILNKNQDLSLIPIIDRNSYVIDFLTPKKIFGDKQETVFLKKVKTVIMAGGKGTRLKPFTQILPKPLIPIREKPVIEHIIESFAKYGVRNFLITINYKSRIIKSFFEEANLKYSIKFLEETKPLGTVGGLRKYIDRFNEPFFVTNCDTIINLDYEDLYKFHKKNNNDITLVASTKDFEIPYGVCELNKKGTLLKIKEKPKFNFLTNTGLYVLSPKILNLVPKNKSFQMTQLIDILRKNKKKVGVYPVEDKLWFDIGQWSEYRDTINRY